MTNWINIIQTIILFTTAIIVLWYTYETYKIRKDTSKQNELISKQISKMEESLRFEIKKETERFKPMFHLFLQGKQNDTEYLLVFTNLGDIAIITSVKPNGDFDANFDERNTNIINTGEKFSISLSKLDINKAKEYIFELNSMNRFKYSYSYKFCINIETGALSEV